MACLLQQLPAAGAERSGGTVLEGHGPGEGNPGPSHHCWVLGRRQRWAALGWSAPQTSGPGVVSPWTSPAAAEGGGTPCGPGGGDMTPSLSLPQELSLEPILAEGLERNWAPLWAVTGWLRRVTVNDLGIGGGGD